MFCDKPNKSVFLILNMLTIRIANEGDVNLLSTLCSKTFDEAFAKDNSAEDMQLYLSENFQPEQIENELQNQGVRFFIAFVNKEAAGYAKMSCKEPPEALSNKNAMEIERIYILEKFQKQKVGAALMQCCILHARELNKQILWLGVWEHNEKAKTFYERFGFIKFGVHDFLLGKDVQQDHLMMLAL